MLATGDIFFHPFFFVARGVRGWEGLGQGGSAVLPTSVSCLGFSRNIPLPPTLSHQPSCMSCPACLIDRATHPSQKAATWSGKKWKLPVSHCIINVGPFFRPPTHIWTIFCFSTDATPSVQALVNHFLYQGKKNNSLEWCIVVDNHSSSTMNVFFPFYSDFSG